MNKEMKATLLKAAVEGSKNAHCPYSKYRVGAAVLTKTGKIYQGGNIENVSYGATVCAERVAIWKAVSEGEKEFEAIAVIGPGTSEGYPCAQCRQVMVEFGLDWLVVSGDQDGNYLGDMTVRELVPFPFTPSALLG
ncbi:MAG: cytidine deaminase [Pelolinea sp.]|nr:cytidine deaminase [Pelolinea sp.]